MKNRREGVVRFRGLPHEWYSLNHKRKEEEEYGYKEMVGHFADYDGGDILNTSWWR
jgi:hypothetical protein